MVLKYVIKRFDTTCIHLIKSIYHCYCSISEREMGELRHVLRELRAFDSQVKNKPWNYYSKVPAYSMSEALIVEEYIINKM